MVSEMHLLKVLVLQLRCSVRNVYLNDKFVKDGLQGRLGFIYIYKHVYFDISTSTFGNSYISTGNSSLNSIFRMH